MLASTDLKKISCSLHIIFQHTWRQRVASVLCKLMRYQSFPEIGDRDNPNLAEIGDRDNLYLAEIGAA